MSTTKEPGEKPSPRPLNEEIDRAANQRRQGPVNFHYEEDLIPTRPPNPSPDPPKTRGK